uniref:T-cell surface glycoprotein CD8 alpha chain n=1 Tax=Leptobrachium leishanense TaxID=445787 RepID=A0A8C5M9W1_9ANUR
MCSTMKGDLQSGLLMLIPLFHLIVCSYQLELYQTSSKLQLGSGGPVHLECRAVGENLMDHGVFWFRQRKSVTSPESILYLSSVSRITQINTTMFGNFTPSKGSNVYYLKINPFREEDQGTYYCMINRNLVLHISPGISLYYPTASTPPNPKSRSTPTKPLGPEDPCTGTFPTTEPPHKEDLSPAVSMSLYASLQLGKLCLAALAIIFSLIR